MSMTIVRENAYGIARSEERQSRSREQIARSGVGKEVIPCL